MPRFFGFMCLVSLLIVPAMRLYAQTPQPIVLEQSLFGEVSPNAPRWVYTFSGALNQVVTVRLLSVTAGFAPSLRLLDGDGAYLEGDQNPTVQKEINLTIQLPSAGDFQIEVTGATQVPGQFVVSLLSGGIEPPPPAPLQVNSLLAGSVDRQIILRRYTFEASPTCARRVTVSSAAAEGGALVTLEDRANGEILGVGSSKLIESQFTVPAGRLTLLLKIRHSGSADAEPYTVLLEEVCP